MRINGLEVTSVMKILSEPRVVGTKPSWPLLRQPNQATQFRRAVRTVPARFHAAANKAPGPPRKLAPSFSAMDLLSQGEQVQVLEPPKLVLAVRRLAPAAALYGGDPPAQG